MPTRTIVHPRIEVNAVTDFHAIPKIICTRTQATKSVLIQPICLTDSEYYYILKVIVRQNKVEFERDVEV